MELTPFLKKIISLPGLSGYETPVREALTEVWKPWVDELVVSRLGSLHALRKGQAAEPRPRILIATHMDTIGLMATMVVEGFVRFTEVGGVDPRILPGQRVVIHGRKPLPGVIAQPPQHTLPPEEQGGAVALKHLLVDTGLLPAEVNRLVRPGDLISFDQPPIELAGETLAGRYLDNRASVAAATLCLEELQHIRHDWDVWVVATVQEEETLAGAMTSAFEIRPTLAVAIDVTFAKGPGASDYRTHPLGKGLTLGWGPNIHPAVHQSFKDLCEQLDIPYHLEVMPRHSGTDAYGMQVVAEGIPSMVVSIPLRYMHTPVELVSLKDIQRTAHLLAQFISRLTPDYVDKMRWEKDLIVP